MGFLILSYLCKFTYTVYYSNIVAPYGLMSGQKMTLTIQHSPIGGVKNNTKKWNRVMYLRKSFLSLTFLRGRSGARQKEKKKT